jgi:hypothetical protein
MSALKGSLSGLCPVASKAEEKAETTTTTTSSGHEKSD